ncbi:MAG: hypothetical protein H8D42_00280 [Candidatus Marinimicrobia bacterium]|nr:hypothetical protein [Candidatus Neomarinimicrobiota bacterium]
MYIKKHLCILTIIVLFSINGAALAEDISGSLSGELGPGDYNVVGMISVFMGASLIIHPGTTFNFTGEYGFDILGYLYAVGTETDSIIFRQGSGDLWRGINFFSLAVDSSIMEYCRVSDSNDKGIYISGVSPTISHCLISHNFAHS